MLGAGALVRQAVLLPAPAVPWRGSHAPERGPDHFSRRSRGVGFQEHSGGSPGGQAKLLVGWRQKATEQV